MAFIKDEFVIEEEIDNHDDEGGESEGAGGEDEFVREGEVNGGADIIDEFVERGEETEKLGTGGSDGDGKKGVPDEKTVDGCFGNVALLPSDFGMGDVGDNGSDGGGDEVGEPEEVVVFDDEIGDNRKKNVVENSNTDTNKDVAGGATAGLDVFGFGSFGGGGGVLLAFFL